MFLKEPSVCTRFTDLYFHFIKGFIEVWDLGPANVSLTHACRLPEFSSSVHSEVKLLSGSEDSSGSGFL